MMGIEMKMYAYGLLFALSMGMLVSCQTAGRKSGKTSCVRCLNEDPYFKRCDETTTNSSGEKVCIDGDDVRECLTIEDCCVSAAQSNDVVYTGWACVPRCFGHSDCPQPTICGQEGFCIECNPAFMDCENTRGRVGAPCQTLDDCQSGLCAQSPDQSEGVCREPCVNDGCPVGFSCRESVCLPALSCEAQCQRTANTAYTDCLASGQDDRTCLEAGEASYSSCMVSRCSRDGAGGTGGTAGAGGGTGGTAGAGGRGGAGNEGAGFGQSCRRGDDCQSGLCHPASFRCTATCSTNDQCGPEATCSGGLCHFDTGAGGEAGGGGEAGAGGAAGAGGSGTGPMCESSGDRCPAACHWVADCAVNSGLCPEYTPGDEGQLGDVYDACLLSCASVPAQAILVCGQTMCEQTISLSNAASDDFENGCNGVE